MDIEGDISSIKTAVEDATADGTPVVVAAGNSGPEYYSIESPGIAEDAITVGAVAIDERIWGHSSRGPTPYEKLVKPEVVCVGVNVECQVPTPDGDITTTTKTGTSVANGIVSGIVTNLQSAHPDWSPQRIKNALVATAKPLTYDGQYYDVFTQGAGLVNAERAIETDLIIEDAVLNFGAVYRTELISQALTIDNISENDYTLEITATLMQVGAANTCPEAIDVSAANVSVPAHGSVDIEVTVHPPDSTGIYSGRLFFHTPEEERVATAILGYVKFDKTAIPSKPEVKVVKTRTQH